MSWTSILALAAGAYGLKALGFFAISRVELRGRMLAVVQNLPVALLAGLIVLQLTEGADRTLMATRIAGCAVGAIAAWRKAPLPLIIVLAAATAALLRVIF